MRAIAEVERTMDGGGGPATLVSVDNAADATLATTLIVVTGANRPGGWVGLLGGGVG